MIYYILILGPDLCYFEMIMYVYAPVNVFVVFVWLWGVGVYLVEWIFAQHTACLLSSFGRSPEEFNFSYLVFVSFFVLRSVLGWVSIRD